MPYLVRPFAAADEQDTDHLVEPDERNGEAASRPPRDRSRGVRLLLEELSEELDERDRELVPLDRLHGRYRKQARRKSRLRIEQRTLIVRHDLPQEFERAQHALLRSLRRLQDLCGVVERPAEQLQARGLAPSCRHGPFVSTARGPLLIVSPSPTRRKF